MTYGKPNIGSITIKNDTGKVLIVSSVEIQSHCNVKTDVATIETGQERTVDYFADIDKYVIRLVNGNKNIQKKRIP